MPDVPREKAPDSTLALLREGYEFASNRCNRHGHDLFEARLDLQPTIFMRGRDAAELLYDRSRFRREGAAPRRLRKTLFGEGGLQGLDDEEHRHRKAMFLGLVCRWPPPRWTAHEDGVRDGFEWHGYRFPAGRRVLLGLYATNHDPRVWDAPDAFEPTRFVGWDGDPFDLVPQGGGDHAAGHRCPGEWATIAIMTAATRLLVDTMRYEVPEQDLRIVRGKVPALPASGFVITRVEQRG